MHLLGPFLLGGIDIESCSGTEFVGLVLTFDTSTSWRGIWEHHGKAVLVTVRLPESLLRAIVWSTGQSRQKDQDWQLGVWLLVVLFWKIEIDIHLGLGLLRVMLELDDLAAKGLDFFLGGERHNEWQKLARLNGYFNEIKKWINSLIYRG
ncbi:hypothetical protein OGAPHI_002233 [Ogataea philodendri]|uniref:Uncharacterized protein n=1 Tax=Ogataea philodendri TaxID=1378263 RepID=A0A9P8T7H7_9ASCO|nr:uncharacterized protein OGAPHI_002233 [Ogataea philodendri]KAH3668479.1 hypothetical protein OGAPHI_002233 [Ogataea philodendri]